MNQCKETDYETARCVNSEKVISYYESFVVCLKLIISLDCQLVLIQSWYKILTTAAKHPVFIKLFGLL